MPTSSGQKGTLIDDATREQAAMERQIQILNEKSQKLEDLYQLLASPLIEQIPSQEDASMPKMQDNAVHDVVDDFVGMDSDTNQEDEETLEIATRMMLDLKVSIAAKEFLVKLFQV